ncbi:uncharacterized protein LOC110845111 [Folsomia candida]|uniref:Uncharacterized protein n=1 Tax=Folsomia candida TaxID=158441 RepID=A0A226ESB2_FOLCA|nr:uncharacterized protein LOC110845111 [Folsomia candida]XP_035704465.1 uncharacterized protein LOC110845111 [Folsomia candida]OXA60140.1 hypothetical protein Fcan01_05054 [Folsomia candida]
MCCGDNLQAQARNVARFEMVVCTFVLVFAAPTWVYMDMEYPDRSKDHAVLYAIFVGGATIELAVSTILYTGTEQDNISKCATWLSINVIGLIMCTVDTIITIISTLDLPQSLPKIIFNGLNYYFLFIVNSYMNEIKGNKQLPECSQPVLYL